MSFIKFVLKVALSPSTTFAVSHSLLSFQASSRYRERETRLTTPLLHTPILTQLFSQLSLSLSPIALFHQQHCNILHTREFSAPLLVPRYNFNHTNITIVQFNSLLRRVKLLHEKNFYSPRQYFIQNLVLLSIFIIIIILIPALISSQKKTASGKVPFQKDSSSIGMNHHQTISSSSFDTSSFDTSFYLY